MVLAEHREQEVDGQRALVVEGGRARLVVLPEIGAKIVSCVDRRTGHEYVWRNPDPSVRFVRPEYAGAFERYDISGWDECFPGIGQCVYPDGPWAGTVVPDHGELWTLPWRAEPRPDGLRLETRGVRFPYTFEKHIALTPDGFATTYRVQNPTPFPFKCFWSTHPLLAATPETRILLPARVRVRVEISFTGRLGPLLSEHPWPRTTDRAGKEVDLSLMGRKGQAEADKLYTTPVAEGWAALHDGATDQWLAFTFDPQQVPLVGFWANRSGWPSDRPCYNLALEPCSGCPDRLDIAVPRSEYQVVPAEGELTWRLNGHLGRGRGPLQELIGSTDGTA
jgi:galactose mutarotase-like enzyme